MSKITLITSGIDWSDATVEPVVMLVDTKMQELYEKWQDWYNGKEDGVKKIYDKFMSFEGWLIENKYARKVTEDEIEYFWET